MNKASIQQKLEFAILEWKRLKRENDLMEDLRFYEKILQYNLQLDDRLYISSKQLKFVIADDNPKVGEPSSKLKIQLLQQIINKLQISVLHDDEYLETEIRDLKAQLKSLLSFEELLFAPIFCNALLTTCPNCFRKEQLHYLKKKIGYLKHVFFRNFIRDLREQFRSIIKFLYKNLDDEHLRFNVLISASFLKSLNQNIHNNGNTGYSSSTSTNYKRK